MSKNITVIRKKTKPGFSSMGSAWSHADEKALFEEYKLTRGSGAQVPPGWWDYIAERFQRSPRAMKNKIHSMLYKAPKTSKPKKADLPPESFDENNPLSQAKVTLRHRWHEAKGTYWVDGQPVSIHDMIRIANRVRKSNNLEQITGSPMWKV
jgi:hypothetical protein